MSAGHGLGHCPGIHSLAAQISAAARRCPRCGRRGALRRDCGGWSCRWGCRGWWTRRELKAVRERLRRRREREAA